ncbi:MAG: DUF423 domain-containing protein [Acetobacteraceae bacterium]|nr:DUF423 domain-containing protein [Acetobacteraceae bacterium]MBV8591474.1 DUF423 domain-containing protein [Acetobacteraceae bacterium]
MAIGAVWIAFGALAGLTAVAMASAAAHGLPQRLDPTAMQSVRNALQMHGWHALALVFCGVWAGMRGGGFVIHAAALVFLLGLLLFCGAAYARALSGIRLPSAGPIGGLLLMLGWVLLGLSAWRF